MRDRVEAAFGRWAGFVWRHRAWISLVMVVLGVGLGTRVPLLERETDPEGYLRGDDPVKIAYDRLRDQFGRDRLVMIAIEPPEVFELGFLEKLRRFHEDLENEVPYLEEITSLVNVRSVVGEDDELVVDDLLEEIPTTDAELAALRERVLNTPSYLDRVISADGRVTALFIETDAYSRIGLEEADALAFDEPAARNGARPYITGRENSEVVLAVRDVMERYRGPDFPISVAGSVLIPHELSLAMATDMPRFLALSMLASAVLLGLSFRRLLPVVLSLLVVSLSVASTLGAAQLLGFHIDLSAQVLPSFLLSVGVGYSVHLIAALYRALDAGATRREALESALRHSGLPILMTGITTIAGLLSFLVASLAPVVAFGLVGATGILMTLAYGLVLLPALIALLPLRPRRGAADRVSAVDRFLGACARMAAQRPWPVVVTTLVVTLVAGAAATRVQLSSDPLSYLPDEHYYRVATDYLDQRFGGSLTVEVVVDAHEENALHRPEVVARIDRMATRVAELQREGETLRRTASYLDVLKETNRALNNNESAHYAIPEGRLLIAQELLLFENTGNDDLEKLVDPQFSMARFTIRTLWEDGFEKIALVDRLNRELKEIMGPEIAVVVTGMTALITRNVGATVESLVSSYGLALALITPLMMLLIGSLRAGLVSMVPNLAPIALTLAIMPLLGITLDMFTLMVGCIAIGLAVDDTIHLIAGFRRDLAHLGDPVAAIDRTLQTTGKAIFFTSFVLALGFLVFVASSMNNLRAFGILTAFAITAAFVIDVVATPAFLVLITRRRAAS